MAASRTSIAANAKNFIFVKELGKGAFATVGLYQYSGKDPIITQLCAESGGYLAIKRPQTTSAFKDKAQEASRQIEQQIDANEKMITATLQSADPAAKNSPYVRGVNLAIDGTHCIALEFVAYKDKQSKKPKSSDLENFLTDTIYDLRHDLTSSSKKPALGLAQMLNSFVVSMKTGLDALHDKGILHLDFAARNCLVSAAEVKDNQLNFSVKVADYGLSRLLPTSGSVPVVNASRMAVHIMDQETLTTKQASIKADIFSLKIALLETLSLMIGKSLSDVTVLKDIDNTDPKAFFLKRLNLTDEEVLKTYLENFNQLVSGLDKEDMRVPLVKSFVQSFQTYLTSMPPSGLSTAETRKQDSALFTSAVAQHAEKIQQALGEKVPDAAKLLEALNLSKPKAAGQSASAAKNSAPANYIVEIEVATKPSSTAAMLKAMPPGKAKAPKKTAAEVSTAADPYSVPEISQSSAKKPAAAIDPYSVPDVSSDKPTTPRRSR
jgi:serine/threonine protein kinase